MARPMLKPGETMKSREAAGAAAAAAVTAAIAVVTAEMGTGDCPRSAAAEGELNAASAMALTPAGVMGYPARLASGAPYVAEGAWREPGGIGIVAACAPAPRLPVPFDIAGRAPPETPCVVSGGAIPTPGFVGLPPTRTPAGAFVRTLSRRLNGGQGSDSCCSIR